MRLETLWQLTSPGHSCQPWAATCQHNPCQRKNQPGKTPASGQTCTCPFVNMWHLRISFPSSCVRCLKERKEWSYHALRFCQINFFIQAWSRPLKQYEDNHHLSWPQRRTLLCVCFSSREQSLRFISSHPPPWMELSIVVCNDGVQRASGRPAHCPRLIPLEDILPWASCLQHPSAQASLPCRMCCFLPFLLCKSLVSVSFKKSPTTFLSSLFLCFSLVRCSYFASDLPGMLLHF